MARQNVSRTGTRILLSSLAVSTALAMLSQEAQAQSPDNENVFLGTILLNRTLCARECERRGRKPGLSLGLGYGWDQGYLCASCSQSKVKVKGGLADNPTALDLGAPLGGVFAIVVQHNPDGSDFTFGGSIEAATRYSGVEGFADAEIPGCAGLNLFAEYASPTIGGLVVRAEVINAVDKEYADRAIYGADFSDVTPFYEPGRTVSIVAAMTF
jgi:outer membrane receptor protein involved in Fe transport